MDIQYGERARNHDRRLPGEPRDCVLEDDALHWIAVYQELVAFLARTEVELPEPLARYQRRLDFWRTRLSQLCASEITEAADPPG